MKWVYWIASIAAIGLGLLLVVGLTAPPLPPAEVVCRKAFIPESERAFCEAHANTERVFRDIQYENAKELAELRDRLMVLRYGEAVANEIYRCTSDPPKHKANQVRCQKLAARVQRDDAEDVAREKRDRDNW